MHPTPHDIEQMGRAALLPLWADVMQSPPPKALSIPFLRRFLAFELQARQSGGLPKKFDKRLEAAQENHVKSRRPALQPGARLLREWNGVTHVIDVTDDGFLWKGDRHRSLSGIAKAITGAHWSGPRFFGLKDEAGS